MSRHVDVTTCGSTHAVGRLKGGSYLDQNRGEDVRLGLAAIVDSSNDVVIPKSLVWCGVDVHDREK